MPVSKNVIAPKNKINGIRETEYVVEKHRIIFKKIRTMDDIPAGEYYPVSTRDDTALLPIKRTATYDDIENVLKSQVNGNSDLLELIKETKKEQEDGDAFVPVHKYFPIEKWNPGLVSADENIQRFLQSKELYRNLKMDYRRSILLHGDPGTGKSQYLYHLSKQLIDDYDAIVIRIEEHSHLSSFHPQIMQNLAKRSDRLKVVIIEELADFTRGGDMTALLHLLDNMHFRENVMFLLTTNYPERIPENVVDRPSRLDLLSGVFSKDYTSDFVDAWYEFILGKALTDNEKEERWYKEIPGKLSPAYMKELFIYSQLLEVSTNEAWELIKERKRSIAKNFAQAGEKTIGFDIDLLEGLE
ncbi:MAG: AAA family ATPase [Balneolaceae bacterium]